MRLQYYYIVKKAAAVSKLNYSKWSRYFNAYPVCFLLLLFGNIAIAQPDSISIHTGSVTTSLANFYDSGGENGNYQNNETIVMTVFPSNSSDKICVTFHEFQTQSGTNADILYVYDGNSTSAPLIAQLSGINYGSIASSASDGSLTFQFISNASTTYFGWNASITMNNTPEDITMIGNSTWHLSSGRFYDNGGPHNNYGDSKDATVTLYPENSSDKLSVTFHEFQTQTGTSADILYVYNGNSTSAPLIAQLSGVNYGTISSTAADGSLTFHFISNAATNYFGWEASISVNNTPEDITMLASGTYTVSTGRFYDNGGPHNNYGDNKDETVTLLPENTGDKVSVTFHECNIVAGDVLYVYNGSSVSDPQLAAITGANYGTITSTAANGALTFRFITNATVNNFGWDASISTNTEPEDITMIANGTFIAKGMERFYDSGGPQYNYGDNQDVITTINPANPSDKLSVTFHSFNTLAGSDILKVYNGDNVGAPLLGTFSGNLTVFTVTSTAANGSLTFEFHSNSSINNYGWFASISNSSSIPSYNMTASASYTIPSGTSAFFYDSGGPNGSYSNNENSIVTFSPANSGDKISVSFNQFYTYGTPDYLEVHDGSSVTDPLLATLNNFAGYGTITASPTNTTGSLTFKFVSNGVTIVDGWAAVITTNANPKNISLPGTYTLPSGTTGFFYDAGGPGANYTNNMNAITTIKPANSGDKISVSFNYFYTYGTVDYLEVHDGSSITDPLLATLNNFAGYGTITASPTNTTGSLTFKFVSNGVTIVDGWAAVITTNANPKNISLPGTYTLPSGTTGFFYDAGGPDANYTDYMNAVTTIEPANSGDKISVSFSYFYTYGTVDYLEVHDGSSITDPLLATLNNFAGYGTITATPANTTGSLTFKFVSNGVTNVDGWEAVITSNAKPKNISLPGTYTLPSGTTGFFYDAGGPDANYTDYMNAVTTIEPANSSDKISVSFNNFNTYTTEDYLEVYDGSSITDSLLGTFDGTINPGTLTSSAADGSLTFRFISNGVSNVSGWAALITASAGCTPGFLGDVNGDDMANSTDALILLSYDAGLPLPQPILDRIAIGFADVNADGVSNSTDALIILSYDAGLPIPFPVGSPVCLPQAAKYGIGKVNSATQYKGRIRATAEYLAENQIRPGEVIEIPVIIDMTDIPEKLGSYTAELEWNPDMFEFEKYSGGSAAGFENPVVNDTKVDQGKLIFAHAYPYGAEGKVNLLNIHLKAVKGASSDISLPVNFTAMAAAETYKDLLPYLNSKTASKQETPNSEIPVTFGSRSYPNPFNPSTTISYQLPHPARVELTIFNLLGQKVITLVSEFQSAGEESVVWDGRNAAGQQVGSGTYFYHLQAGDLSETHKMLLAR